MKPRLYVDTRGRKDTESCPIYIVIQKARKAGFVPTGLTINPEFWDAAEQRPKRVPPTVWPERQVYETAINAIRSRVDRILALALADGTLSGMTAKEIAAYVRNELEPKEEQPILFADRLRSFANIHSSRSKELYLTTLKRIGEFCDVEHLRFEDITVRWLKDFDAFMARRSPSLNARAIHLRNIRAVFNDAIDDDITNAYPFRKFKIRVQETEKRDMTLDEIRAFMAMPSPSAEAEYHRDMFILMFMLIGMNLTDILSLTPSSYRNGRITYSRAKTHKLYSVKVEPEALAIINKHKGKKHLLEKGDRYKNPRDYNRYINRGIRSFSTDEPFCSLTTYWARHTWATLAVNELDIPKETVSAALGHRLGSKITSVYIDFDQRKVDEANRRVIDLVFGE